MTCTVQAYAREYALRAARARALLRARDWPTAAAAFMEATDAAVHSPLADAAGGGGDGGLHDGVGGGGDGGMHNRMGGGEGGARPRKRTRRARAAPPAAHTVMDSPIAAAGAPLQPWDAAAAAYALLQVRAWRYPFP